MGSFFSQKTFPLEAQAGEATEPETEKLAQTLKETFTKVWKSPTPKRSKRDGRSYKEVVRSGRETGSMSKLRESSSAWEFCKAPEDKQMQEEEPVPQQSGDRKGTG